MHYPFGGFMPNTQVSIIRDNSDSDSDSILLQINPSNASMTSHHACVVSAHNVAGRKTTGTFAKQYAAAANPVLNLKIKGKNLVSQINAAFLYFMNSLKNNSE